VKETTSPGKKQIWWIN